MLFTAMSLCSSLKITYILNLVTAFFLLIPIASAQEDVSCYHCHTKEAKDYMTSIHWEEIKKSHPEAATCTDCHGIHEIRAIKDNKSLSNHQNSPATCAKCHSNPEIMSAWYYGIKTDRFDTYKESFNWKALKNGHTLVG